MKLGVRKIQLTRKGETKNFVRFELPRTDAQAPFGTIYLPVKEAQHVQTLMIIVERQGTP